MLRLKKVQPKQQQIIEEENMLEPLKQQEIESNLEVCLVNLPLDYQRLTQFLAPSISGKDFVSILSTVLKEENINQSPIEQTSNFLEELIGSQHDKIEVKNNLKRHRNIDIGLLLAILWQQRFNRQTWKYIEYVVESFPAELMLNGKPYLRKWQQFLQEQEQQLKRQQQVVIKMEEQRARSQVQKQGKGYRNIYINL